MALHDLPHASRPRERLLQHGAAALGDVELLALLLRTGTAGRNVLVMAQDVLDACQGLAGLLHADARTLGQIKGLGGTAKRAELLAVMELARRAMAQQLQQRTLLNHPALVSHYLQAHLGNLPHECFAVLFLDSQHQLIQLETLFRGTLNQTSVYPREVVKAALARNAAAVIFAHNHPSGVAEPSRADELLTTSLKSALALVDIRTLDHFVVAGTRVVSFAERGLL